MERNITLPRGDTLAFGLEFDGLEQELDSVEFTAYTNYDKGTTIFSKTLSDGVEVVESEKYRIRVAPEDTASVLPGGYPYDLKISVNNDRFTLMRGILTLVM